MFPVVVVVAARTCEVKVADVFCKKLHPENVSYIPPLPLALLERHPLLGYKLLGISVGKNHFRSSKKHTE